MGKNVGELPNPEDHLIKYHPVTAKKAASVKAGKLTTHQKIYVVLYALLGTVLLPVIGTIAATVLSIQVFRKRNMQAAAAKPCVVSVIRPPLSQEHSLSATAGTLKTTVDESKNAATKNAATKNGDVISKENELRRSQAKLRGALAAHREGQVNVGKGAEKSTDTPTGAATTNNDELKVNSAAIPLSAQFSTDTPDKIGGELPNNYMHPEDQGKYNTIIAYQVELLQNKNINTQRKKELREIIQALRDEIRYVSNVCWMNASLKLLAATNKYDHFWYGEISQDDVLAYVQITMGETIRKLRAKESIDKSLSLQLIEALKAMDAQNNIFTFDLDVIGEGQKDAVEFVDSFCRILQDKLGSGLQENPVLIQAAIPVGRKTINGTEVEVVYYGEVINRNDYNAVTIHAWDEKSNSDQSNQLLNISELVNKSEDIPDLICNAYINSEGRVIDIPVVEKVPSVTAPFRRETRLVNAPDLLRVNIQRVAFVGGERLKNHRKLDIKEDGTIKIWEYSYGRSSHGSLINSKRKAEHTYQLQSAVVHIGNAGGGHWVNYQRLSDDSWVLHDDNHLYLLSSEQALNGTRSFSGVKEASIAHFKRLS